MKKLLKYLRPFAGSIVIAIMLLFVQAISDLSLPSYMSNIVNIGIQQKGIEDAVPKAINLLNLINYYYLLIMMKKNYFKIIIIS